MGRGVRADNTVYDTKGHTWWEEDAGPEFATLRHCVNPARFAYFSRKLLAQGIAGGRLLDLGCGGGFLSEEFARRGYRVTGLDPSEPSLRAARAHALLSGLAIEYRAGVGERMPFADAGFDLVACCDVLEHVEDPRTVLAECARVLRPGGVLLFDTINRTLKSAVVAVFLAQSCPLTRYMPPGTHVWRRFLTPAELRGMLAASGMAMQEVTGLGLREGNPVALLRALVRGAKTTAGREELLKRLSMCEQPDLSISYMGLANKG